MNSEDAEIVALRALSFLAADTRRIEGFCRMTGTGPADLPALARSRTGLAAVLDYLMGDEAMLLAFAAEAEIPETGPGAAYRTLAGRKHGDATP